MTHTGAPDPLLGCPKQGTHGQEAQATGNDPGEFSGSRGGAASSEGCKRGDAAIFHIRGPQPERDAAWYRDATHWELGRTSSGRAPEHRKLHLLKVVGKTSSLCPAASTAAGSQRRKSSP